MNPYPSEIFDVDIEEEQKQNPYPSEIFDSLPEPQDTQATMYISARQLDNVNQQEHVDAYDIAKENGVDTNTVINAPEQFEQPKTTSRVGKILGNFLNDDRGNAIYGDAERFKFLEDQYRIKQQRDIASHSTSFGTGDNLSYMQLGIREAKLQRGKIQPLRNKFWGDGTLKDDNIINNSNTQMSLLNEPESLFEDVVAASSGEIYDMAMDIEQAKYGLAIAGAIKAFTPAGKGWTIASTVAGAGTMTAVGAEQEMLYFYEELGNLRDKQGKPLDNDIARGVSTFYGMTSGLLENIPALRTFNRTIPDINIFGKFTKKQLKEKLKQPSYKAAFKKFGMNFTQGMAEESFTEIVQQLSQDLMKNATLVSTGGEERWKEEDFVTLKELGDNMTNAGVEALKGSVGIHGGMSTYGLNRDIRKARESIERLDSKQEIFDAINNEEIKKSGTVGKEFSDETSIDANAEGNYINPDMVEKFFQDSELTEDEINEIFPLTNKAIEEAKEVDDGREINIPDHEFAQFSESESANEIMDNYRESVDGLTRAEAIQLNKEINESIENQEDESPIFKDVYGQLKTMGATDYVARQQALLWDATIRTRARRHNLSPEEMYAESKLDVSQEDVRAGNTLDNYERLDSLFEMIRKDTAPSERQAYGSSIMQFLTDEGGLQDEGGELSARDVGRVGTKNLIQSQEKGGITLDEAIERLVENGYFGGETGDYAHQDVLDAIDDELLGVPAYTEQSRDQNMAALKEEVNYISDALERMGVDITTMTNEEVKTFLKEQAFFQSEDSRVPDDAPVIKTDGAGITNAKEAREYAKNHFRGDDGKAVHVINKSDNSDIEISLSGIKHTAQGAQDNLLKTIAITDKILSESVFIGSAKDTKNKETKNVHYYGIKVDLDGVEHDVVAVVKEFNDGRRYYDHSIEIIRPQQKLVSDSNIIGVNQGSYSGSKPETTSDIESLAYPKSVSGASDSDPTITLKEEDDNTSKLMEDYLPNDKLFQKKGEKAKGYYERTPLRDVFKITLTGRADLSTFLHESGHAFLDMMIKDAEQFDDAKQEMDILMKWMGVDNINDIQTEQHEQFARGFEAYLRTGKAPSNELKEAFRNFKLWLKNIYKQMRQLNVELTPEVTGVMNRMLASEKEIDEARHDAGILPMYEEQNTDLSQEDYDKYREEYNRTMAENLESLDAARITAYNKQIQFMNKERKAKAKKQAEENIANDYRAWMALKNKAVLPDHLRFDGQKEFTYSGKNRKLTKESILRTFPDLPTDRMRGLYSVENGIDADTLAAQLGYESGTDMVTELANQAPYNEALSMETANILKDEYGEQDIIPNAKNAVHGDSTTDFIKAELKTLGKREGVAQQIKLQAKEVIRKMTLANIKPVSFERAERKASRAAMEALANGDKTTAALEKQRQLLNHHLFKEATKALQQADKQYRFLKNFEKKSKRKNIGLAGESYLNAIDLILEKIQLRKVSNKFLKRKASLKRYIDAMFEEGTPVDEKLLHQVKDKNYREMTVDEFSTAYEAVKNVDSMARNKKKWQDVREKKDLQEVMDTIVDSVYQSKKSKKITPAQRSTIVRKMEETWEHIDAALVKQEWFVRWLDGGDKAGEVHSYIFQPFVDAEAHQMDMMEEYTTKISKLIEGIDNLNGNHKFMGTDYKKHQIIAIALNVGNEGNLQRLMDGYGWSYTQLMTELERHITKDEWSSIQDIWNTIDTLYKPMSDVAQRVEGDRPPKVDATEFTVHGKKMKGGYYPAYYDPKHSKVGASQVEVGSTAGAFVKSQAKSSMAQARAEKFVGKIDIDLMRLAGHINETVFYITHYEAVRNTWRVISNDNFREALNETWGNAYFKAMGNWLDTIARNGMPLTNDTAFDKLMTYARNATSIAAMGYSVTTALVQPLGLFNTAKEVGGARVMMSAAKFIRNPAKMYREINEKSAEFRHLINMYDRDLKKRMDVSFNTNKALKAYNFFKDNAFFMIAGIQKMVNAITYDAAYSSALLEDISAKQAHKKAESTVRLTQSMAGNKDMAWIQTADGIKNFVMFYSFFSAFYGQLRNFDPTDVKDVKKMTAYGLYLMVLPSMVDTFMRGSCDDEDNEAACYAKQTALYGVATVPLARDVISGIFGDYGTSLTPLTSLASKFSNSAKMTFTDKDFETLKFLQGVMPVFRLPTKPIKYIENSQEADNLHEVFYGVPK